MTVIRSKYQDIHIPEDTSFLEFIENREQLYRNKVALIDYSNGRSVTYSELFTRIHRIGGSLSHRGLRKGEMVLCAVPNTIDCVIFSYGVISVGGIVAVADPMEHQDELERRILECRPRFAFCDMQAARHIQTINHRQDDIIQEIFSPDSFPGCCSIATLLSEEFPPPNVTINPVDDVAYMCYSSGTSGHPKGVLITHYNFVSSASIFLGSPQHEFRADDKVMTTMPMFHSGGLTVCYYSLAVGCTFLFCSRFKIEQFLRTIEHHQVSLIWIPPPAIVMIYKKYRDFHIDLSSIRTVATGAAPVTAAVSKMAVESFPKVKRIMQTWGMTECSVNMTVSPRVGWKHGSMGELSPNCIIKICDINTGTMLPLGQAGHLHIKGPTVMKGYHGNNIATNDVMKDGWLATGDVAYCDVEGNFYFIDRIKELIKYNAHGVAPAELESIIITHPCILDTAVYGIPDEVAGELIRAAVVKKPGCSLLETDVVHFVKERVSPMKRIRGGVEFVEKIEKTASGKILRRHLRDNYKRSIHSKL